MNTCTQWVHADKIKEVAPSADAQSWLLEAGSITARLRHDWPNTQVTVLDEGLQTPHAEECGRLELQPCAPCWVREVRLHAAGQPLVHARTVIPQWGPGNPWQELEKLGDRPLGELLFQLPGLQRSLLEFGITPPDTLYGCVNQAMSRPARRCTYTRHGALLLLTEAFDFLATPTAPGN